MTRLERKGATLPSIQVTSPEDIARGLKKVIGDAGTERFIVLYLNAQNCVIAYGEYTSGDVTSVTVHPADVARGAIESGAVAFITVHNHPSGLLDPSDADYALWKRLRKIGELIGVPDLDHLIVSGDDYYSFREGR